jgi:lysophospholipase L1-like esterase
MKRIETENREIDKFGAGMDGFRASVPGVSDATYLSAKFLNAVQESIVLVIEAAGEVPSDDHDQFLRAIGTLATTIGQAAGDASRDAAAASAAQALAAISSTTYAAGLASVADGSYFSVRTASSQQVRFYKREAGYGVLQSVRPFMESQRATVAAAMLRSPIAVGSMPRAPLIDFDSVLALSGFDNFRNLSNVGEPDLNAISYGFANVVTAQVTTAQNAAVVTAGAADALGGLKGFHVTGAGAASGTPPRCTAAGGFHVPAGKWTIAFDAQAVGGTQAFAWHPDLLGSLGAVAGLWQVVPALTTALTPLSYTFEVTTDVIIYPVWASNTSAVPSAAMDVNVSFLRVNPGAVAGPRPTPGSHVSQARLKDPVQSGLLLTNAGTDRRNSMCVQLPSKRVFTEISATFCGRWDGDFVSNTNNVVLSGSEHDTVLSNSNFFFSTRRRSSITLRTPSGFFTGAPLASPYNAGFFTFGFTAGAAGRVVYFNGRIVGSDAVAFGSIDTSFFALLAQYAAFSFTGDSSGITVHDSVLTPAQMATVHNVLAARLSLKGASINEGRTFLFSEGDSISIETGTTGSGTGWNVQMGSNFTPYMQGRNFAISGSTMASLEGRQAAVVAAITAMVAEGKNIIATVFIGANDLVGITTSPAAIAYYARLVAYWAALRAAGGKVIACTLIPRSGLASETYLNQINTLIRGDATKYDRLCDFALNALFTTYNAANYTDGLHPNNASHDTMAGILLPHVQALYV